MPHSYAPFPVFRVTLHCHFLTVPSIAIFYSTGTLHCDASHYAVFPWLTVKLHFQFLHLNTLHWRFPQYFHFHFQQYPPSAFFTGHCITIIHITLHLHFWQYAALPFFSFTFHVQFSQFFHLPVYTVHTIASFHSSHRCLFSQYPLLPVFTVLSIVIFQSPPIACFQISQPYNFLITHQCHF